MILQLVPAYNLPLGHFPVELFCTNHRDKYGMDGSLAVKLEILFVGLCSKEKGEIYEVMQHLPHISELNIKIEFKQNQISASGS